MKEQKKGEEGISSPSDEQKKPFWRNPWVIAAVSLMITMPLLRPFLRHVPKPPPVMSQLPSFSLKDQNGKPFSLENMKGHVTVVDFFFTRCPSICPMLTKAMKSLQDRFQRNKLPIRLLSISVDAEYDTSERLLSYAKKWGADTKRWTFASGTSEEIKRLAIKGFRTAMSRPKKIASFSEIVHSSRLILVDQKGQIRGRPDQEGNPIGYFGTSKMALDELFYRAQRTMWEKYK